MQPERTAPEWTTRALRLAAILDVLVGAFVVFAPEAPFAWADLESPAYPEAWQGLGLAIAVYGLGYLLVARNPLRHWPVVAMGLLAKVALSVGFLWSAAAGHLPWELGILVLAFGPVQWVPFWLILRRARQAYRSDQTPPVMPLDMALSFYQDPDGTDLLEASKQQPQFLVFLRHFGCTFCREALSDLAAIQDRLRATGTRLVLVHMSTEFEARDMIDKHGLEDAIRISDPERVLYRAFALRRGSPSQLFGWSVWKRGWEAGVKEGHGIGWLRGDAAQMPGAFVVSHGQVVAQFIHESASDRPDYVVVAAEGADQAEFQQELESEGVGLGFQSRLRAALSSEASSES